MDCYAYKQLPASGILDVNLDEELYKQNVIDNYELNDLDMKDQTV